MEKRWDIPVIDVWRIGLDDQAKLVSDTEAFTQIGGALVEGLKQYGVVYLINHGIDQRKFHSSRQMARKFLDLPTDVKIQSQRPQSNITSGWLGMGMEYSGNDYSKTGQMGDIKEAINVFVADLDTFPWPDETVLPGFRWIHRDFFQQCIQLSKNLAHALDARLSPETHTILAGHQRIGAHGNFSHGKHLYYPPVDKNLPSDLLRLNEHTDWGTFTLLLQDDCGGLQMRDREGVIHHVAPLEGAILLQAADMLQRWTSDDIWSMPHRVAILPENRDKARESTVYFVCPDDGYPVSPLDGSDTYETTDMADYSAMMMRQFQQDDETVRKKTLQS